MGEVFAGRFELIDAVAAGGMGEVWTARDLRDGSVVAVKLLKQADAGGLLRFMREQALRIHHDHILTPLAWAGIDDRVLFSMPLARGGSVADLMKTNGLLPQRFAAELLRQTLDGLAAVHAAGVVHRDVKPANLLLEATGTERPHLLLSDFGVALPLDEPRLTTQALVIGTPGYLAPEQAAGGDAAPEQDLYAVGMVGKELLTGVRPKRDGTAVQTPPLGTDPALWDLLDRLTALHPGSRPSLAEAQRVLAAADLAWVPQDRVRIPAKIRPDGHLAGPDDDRAWSSETVRASAPDGQGGPGAAPAFQPSGPPFQPSAPQVAGAPPQFQPSAPRFQDNAPRFQASAPQFQPSGPQVQPSAPPIQPGSYPGAMDDATTFRPRGNLTPAGRPGDSATYGAPTIYEPAPRGASRLEASPVVAPDRAPAPRGRRLLPLAVMALGLVLLIAAAVVALTQ